MREPHTVLRCLEVLTQINWDGAGFLDTVTPEGTNDIILGFNAIAMGYITGEYTPSNMLLYRLWERENYIRAQQRFDEIYRAQLPCENFLEAKRLAIQQYTQEILDHQIKKESEISSREDVEGAVFHILRRGARWTELMHAVDSAEILLIDQRMHVMKEDTIIGNVIEHGTNEEFDVMKEFLIAPENRVKEDCLRLSGVSQMALDLADSPRNSQLRNYLTTAIRDRIELVYGRPAQLPELNHHGKIRFPCGRPQRDIVDIFGIMLRFPLAG